MQSSVTATTSLNELLFPHQQQISNEHKSSLLQAKQRSKQKIHITSHSTLPSMISNHHDHDHDHIKLLKFIKEHRQRLENKQIQNQTQNQNQKIFKKFSFNFEIDLASNANGKKGLVLSTVPNPLSTKNLTNHNKLQKQQRQQKVRTPSYENSVEDEGLGKSPTHLKSLDLLADNWTLFDKAKKSSPLPPPSSVSVTNPSRTRGRNLGRSSTVTPPTAHDDDDSISANGIYVPRPPQTKPTSSVSTPNSPTHPLPAKRRFSDDTRLGTTTLLTARIPINGSASRSTSPLRRTSRERTASITRLASDLETAKDDLDNQIANTFFNQALKQQLGSKGHEADLPKAIKYYEMAANLGHTKSMINAAQLYESAPQVFDSNRAKELLFLACRKKDVRALTYVGAKLCQGDPKLEINQDIKRGHEFLRKAIKRKSPDAMLQMSKCYRHGIGFQCKNPSIAFSLCKSAAQLNHAGAEAMLGMCYANGIGTDVNLYQAQLWYTRAANRGHKSAKQLLRFLLEGDEFEKESHTNAIAV